MRNLMLAAATALSVAAIPVAAQQAGDASFGSTNSIADKRSMTPAERVIYDAIPAEQRPVFDSWDSDNQVLYFGWTDALRGYYWSLDEEQQNAWWYLTPEQQASLFQIQDEAARDMAWTSVTEQVAALDGPKNNEQFDARGSTTGATHQQSRADVSERSQARDVTYVSNAMVQDAPAPRQGEYPVCMEANSSDNCINAWAAGERGPGVTRPLDYWPDDSARDNRMGG